ncbi:hypothetical protein EDB85DRAFT_1896247 [Lactarius pseudohatsudake]|nr:hypothetical protein EDB85DRAFT_1896247 [Lactarius pseudohatsudake]
MIEKLRRPGKVPFSSLPVLLYLGFTPWISSRLTFIPLAWASQYDKWGRRTTYSLCLLAIVPLDKLLYWDGEQMTMYLWKDLDNLVMVTLNNAVAATLAIDLLFKCETTTGWLAGWLPQVQTSAAHDYRYRIFNRRRQNVGTKAASSPLSVYSHALYSRPGLCLALTIPAAFSAVTNIKNNNGPENAAGLSDFVGNDFLCISRGFSVALLVIYVGSRFYLHDPPSANNALAPHPDIPEEVLRMEQELKESEPEPEVFFATSRSAPRASGLSKHAHRYGHPVPALLDAICDAPRLVDNKPMSMLFGRRAPSKNPPSPYSTKNETRADLFEIMLLISPCFLLSHVMADAKTNWAEDAIFIAFCTMIALVPRRGGREEEDKKRTGKEVEPRKAEVRKRSVAITTKDSAGTRGNGEGEREARRPETISSEKERLKRRECHSTTRRHQGTSGVSKEPTFALFLFLRAFGLR